MLEKDLLNSVTSEKLSEIAVDGAELAIDSILHEGLLKDIPIVGTIYKIGRASIGVREAIFTKKVLKFLQELKDIPLAEREEFLRKLEENAKYSNRVGEKLLVLIERLDDIDKSSVIGRLFKAAVAEKIDYETFLKLSSIVDKAFLPDLLKLRGETTDQWGIRHTSRRLHRDVQEHFYTIGIMSIEVKDDTQTKHIRSMAFIGGKKQEGFVPAIEFQFNNLGHKLIQYGINQE